jgi:hypothetical protein
VAEGEALTSTVGEAWRKPDASGSPRRARERRRLANYAAMTTRKDVLVLAISNFAVLEGPRPAEKTHEGAIRVFVRDEVEKLSVPFFPSCLPRTEPVVPSDSPKSTAGALGWARSSWQKVGFFHRGQDLVPVLRGQAGTSVPCISRRNVFACLCVSLPQSLRVSAPVLACPRVSLRGLARPPCLSLHVLPRLWKSLTGLACPRVPLRVPARPCSSLHVLSAVSAFPCAAAGTAAPSLHVLPRPCIPPSPCCALTGGLVV